MRFSSQRLEIMSLNPPHNRLAIRVLSADKLTYRNARANGAGLLRLLESWQQVVSAIGYDFLIQFLVGLVVGIGGGIALAGMSVVAPKIAMWGGALLILFYFSHLYLMGITRDFLKFGGMGKHREKEKWESGTMIKDDGRPLTPAESIAET